MNIEVDKISDAGNLDKERVILRVLNSGELGFYVVFKTKKTSTAAISSKVAKTYWFPDRQVNKGDYIVIYSKVGVNTEKTNTDGTKSHFFYWGSPDSIWNKPEDSVVLSKIDEWTYKSVS